MEAAQKPPAFNPKVVFAMIFLGALAFLATLYLIGTGDTGGDTNNGGAHGSGKGLNGYAALAGMLEAEGRDVSFSRTPRALDGANLLILTPGFGADPAEVTSVIEARRFAGPTLVIVPKWRAFETERRFGGDSKDGWVELESSMAPAWAADLGDGLGLSLSDNVAGNAGEQGWSGLGYSGSLPDPRYSSSDGIGLIPLAANGQNKVLAGYLDDASMNSDDDIWPVTFVIEPDLVNNYGLADRNRARLASGLIDAAQVEPGLPIVFDLTFNGFGASKNLLTLAFTPPFLAATLCLILAMIIVAWRAFRRFGPAAAQSRAVAFGKARLVKNSAGFVQRSKRLHLLSEPYADLLRDRIVKALALKNPDDEAIDNALAKRNLDSQPFSTSVNSLRSAKSPKDIMRSAAALKTIERMLSK